MGRRTADGGRLGVLDICGNVYVQVLGSIYQNEPRNLVILSFFDTMMKFTRLIYI